MSRPVVLLQKRRVDSVSRNKCDESIFLRDTVGLYASRSLYVVSRLVFIEIILIFCDVMTQRVAMILQDIVCSSVTSKPLIPFFNRTIFAYSTSS